MRKVKGENKLLTTKWFQFASSLRAKTFFEKALIAMKVDILKKVFGQTFCLIVKTKKRIL